MRRPRSRWDLVLAWVVILAPALALASWLAVRQQVGDLEARLIRDTNELFVRTYPRYVHVDTALPGAIGDAVERHLPPFEAAAKAFENNADGIQRARDVVSGAAPVADLPAPFAAALARLEPDLDALLAATRAERADFPATKDFATPLDGCGWAGWQLAATFAGVRMRLSLAAGDSRSALRDGLDALALGRDAAIARGLVGRMVGAAIFARLAAPLSDAVDALPDARTRRDAPRRLRAIRDAIPRFSRTLADEITYTQLFMSDALSGSARAALDPRARAVTLVELRDTAWWQRLAIRDGWRDLRAAQDALVAAADLPDGDRAAAFAAAGARVMRSVNPYAAIALPNYTQYARRSDAAARRLDALVLAAATGAFRDDHGHWPASIAEIAAVGDVDPSEVARLAGAGFEPADGGRDLSVHVPLPPANEKEAKELVIVLRRQRGARAR